MPSIPPAILGLIPDLFFSSRVGSAAQALGYTTHWVERPDSFAETKDFLSRLHALSPALIILDLNAALPWPDWLAAAKGDPELAAIPWLAFGSHKDTEALAKAKRCGADRVVARSKFSAELPALIRSLAGEV